MQIITLSINNWSHLYSLEQAVRREQQASGKNLSINGTVRNIDFLDKQDTPVSINFYQVDSTPTYHTDEDDQLILGELLKQNGKLSARLPVDEKVFEELRKNLMEYADIDGIHIIVTIGIALDGESWPDNTACNINRLDYAMRGDA